VWAAAKTVERNRFLTGRRSVRRREAMMSQTQIVIDFPNSSDAEQDDLAKNLAQEIGRVDGVNARPRHPDTKSQFGASEVQLLLNTHAIDAVAIGIQAWLALRNKTTIRVRRGKDEVTIRNTTSQGAIEALKAFLRAK
jgi:hypothetical protein